MTDKRDADFMNVALRSGSSGNAIFLKNGHDSFLVDAGVNCKQIGLALAQIEESAANLTGIFLTHEHSDHCFGLPVLMRKYHIKLYTSAATYAKLRPSLMGVDESLVNFVRAGEKFVAGETLVLPFPLSHDCVDPLGYRIYSDHGDVAVLTDTGVFTEEQRQGLINCKYVYLEANYDESMLERSVKYPFYLKKRIASSTGHLSNAAAADAAFWLFENGTRAISLSHLSQETNMPSTAVAAVQKKFMQNHAILGVDMVLQISDRYQVSRPLCV